MSYEYLEEDRMGYSSRPSLPPGALVQSGGGVSNMHHGHPQGPYSRSAHRYDLFGNSMPQTIQTKGSMYASGPSYMENVLPMGARQPFRKPYEFQDSYQQGIGQSSGMNNPHMGGGNFGNTIIPPSSRIEPFQQDEEKAVTSLDDTDFEDEYEMVDEKKTSQYWILFLYIVLFIAITYWTKSTDMALNRYLFGDIKPTFWHYGIIAIILTLLFLIALYLTNTNLKIFDVI